MRKKTAAGIALVVVGLFLVFGFWPLFSVNGVKLAAAQSGGSYYGYAPGAQVLLHDKVVDVSYSAVLGVTYLDFNSGDPNAPFTVIVQGDARGVVAPGETIYATAYLQSGLLGLEAWEIPSPGNIQQAWPVDALFYGVTGVGVLSLLVAASTSRRALPEG